MKQALYIKNKLTIYQKLLIVAMGITPFTALRPTFVGFGELFFIIAFFYEFNKSQKKIRFHLFSKFWLIYITFTLIGIIYNTYILGFKNVEIKGMIFDFSSYVVVFMTCFLFERLISNKKINTYLFLKYIFLFFSTTLSILYFISFYKSSLFGYSLIYAETFFVPFTENLHQISMFLSPLIFVGVLLLKTEKNKIIRIFILSLIVLDIIMDFNTGSDKAILSTYVGAGILILFSIFNHFKGKSKAVFISLMLLFFVPATILNYKNIKASAVDFFQESDNNNARQFLYSNAIEIGMDSPIFGYGPGQHVPDANNKLWDTHQTFLAIFLQTGIFGIILIAYLFFKIFTRLLNNPILFAAFIPIFIYASGGDILRKLSIWIFLILFYYYKKSDEQPYVIQYINTDSKLNNKNG